MTEKIIDQTTMEGMIYNANDVLDVAMDPKTMGVPRNIMKDCKGVVLITIVRAGFIFSGAVGTGVIIAQNDEGQWSPPSAVSIGSVGFGLLFGANVKDVLMIVMDDLSMKALTGKRQVKLGEEVGLTVGPVGREYGGSYNLSNKGVGCLCTYAFAKGAFAGIGLEGGVVGARPRENEKFYGVKASPQEILMEGAVTAPEGKGVEELHRKLDLMKEGATGELTDAEKEKKESLRAAADAAGKAAKDYQGDEVIEVDAAAEAAKEKEESAREG